MDVLAGQLPPAIALQLLHSLADSACHGLTALVAPTSTTHAHAQTQTLTLTPTLTLALATVKQQLSAVIALLESSASASASQPPVAPGSTHIDSASSASSASSTKPDHDDAQEDGLARLLRIHVLPLLNNTFDAAKAKVGETITPAPALTYASTQDNPLGIIPAAVLAGDRVLVGRTEPLRLDVPQPPAPDTMNYTPSTEGGNGGNTLAALSVRLLVATLATALPHAQTVVTFMRESLRDYVKLSLEAFDGNSKLDGVKSIANKQAASEIPVSIQASTLCAVIAELLRSPAVARQCAERAPDFWAITTSACFHCITLSADREVRRSIGSVIIPLMVQNAELVLPATLVGAPSPSVGATGSKPLESFISHLWAVILTMSRHDSDAVQVDAVATLCAMYDLFFVSRSDHVRGTQPVVHLSDIVRLDLRRDARFWELVHHALKHADFLTNNRGVYLIKRVLDTTAFIHEVVPGGDSNEGWTDYFHGERTSFESQRVQFEEFCLLYDTFQETSLSIIDQVLVRWVTLLPRRGTATEGNFHGTWFKILFDRLFRNENRRVIHRAFRFFLRQDVRSSLATPSLDTVLGELSDEYRSKNARSPAPVSGGTNTSTDAIDDDEDDEEQQQAQAPFFRRFQKHARTRTTPAPISTQDPRESRSAPDASAVREPHLLLADVDFFVDTVFRFALITDFMTHERHASIMRRHLAYVVELLPSDVERRRLFRKLIHVMCDNRSIPSAIHVFMLLASMPPLPGAIDARTIEHLLHFEAVTVMMCEVELRNPIHALALLTLQRHTATSLPLVSATANNGSATSAKTEQRSGSYLRSPASSDSEFPLTFEQLLRFVAIIFDDSSFQPSALVLSLLSRWLWSIRSFDDQADAEPTWLARNIQSELAASFLQSTPTSPLAVFPDWLRQAKWLAFLISLAVFNNPSALLLLLQNVFTILRSDLGVCCSEARPMHLVQSRAFPALALLLSLRRQTSAATFSATVRAALPDDVLFQQLLPTLGAIVVDPSLDLPTSSELIAAESLSSLCHAIFEMATEQGVSEPVRNQVIDFQCAQFTKAWQLLSTARRELGSISGAFHTTLAVKTIQDVLEFAPVDRLYVAATALYDSPEALQQATAETIEVELRKPRGWEVGLGNWSHIASLFSLRKYRTLHQLLLLQNVGIAQQRPLLVLPADVVRVCTEAFDVVELDGAFAVLDCLMLVAPFAREVDGDGEASGDASFVSVDALVGAVTASWQILAERDGDRVFPSVVAAVARLAFHPALVRVTRLHSLAPPPRTVSIKKIQNSGARGSKRELFSIPTSKNTAERLRAIFDKISEINTTRPGLMLTVARQLCTAWNAGAASTLEQAPFVSSYLARLLDVGTCRPFLRSNLGAVSAARLYSKMFDMITNLHQVAGATVSSDVDGREDATPGAAVAAVADVDLEDPLALIADADAEVRAIALGYISSLSSENPTHIAIAKTTIDLLIQRDSRYSGMSNSTTGGYFPDSDIFIGKLHVWQGVLLLTPVVLGGGEPDALELVQRVLQTLDHINHMTIRTIMEWVIVLTVLAHPTTAMFDALWSPFTRSYVTTQTLNSLCAMCMQLARALCADSLSERSTGSSNDKAPLSDAAARGDHDCAQPRTASAIRFCARTLDFVLPWITSHQFAMRLYAQATVVGMAELLASSHIPLRVVLGDSSASARAGETDNQMGSGANVVGHVMKFLATSPECVKHANKLKRDFSFSGFDPVLDFNVELIVYYLPLIALGSQATLMNVELVRKHWHGLALRRSRSAPTPPPTTTAPAFVCGRLHKPVLLCEQDYESHIFTYVAVRSSTAMRQFVPRLNEAAAAAAEAEAEAEAAAEARADAEMEANEGKPPAPEDQEQQQSAAPSTNVQKKLTPWQQATASMVGVDAASPLVANGPVAPLAGTGRSDLIVVASLIDRVPNLGGLTRTCEIFKAGLLVMHDLRVTTDDTFKQLSVTADKWMPLKQVEDHALPAYLKQKKSEGYTLVGVEQTAEGKRLSNFSFPQKSLILLGRERTGIPVDLIQLLDVCVEIPQFGVVRSLNVHVSAALMVWEYARQHIVPALGPK